MSLSSSLESIVSRIVKEEPVSTTELQEAGNALLSKEAKAKSKKGIGAKIQSVITSQAHNMEMRRSGLKVKGKLPFRFIKKRPELKAKLNAVILKALVKKEKEKSIPADKEKPETETKERDEAFRKEYEELEALRLSDPDAELARLKSNPKIHAIFNKVTKSMKCSREHLIALGHSLEIKEKFGDKYYIFTHGQNSQHMILNLVAKRLQEIFRKTPVWGEMPLRHPCFTKHIKPSQTPRWFFRKCNKIPKGDFAFTKELLCADAYLGSTATLASANYFTAPGNPNFAAGRRFIQNCLQKQLQACLPGRDVKPLLDKFMALHDEIPDCSISGGNMYVICVPKENFVKTGFLSTIMGKRCPSCKGKENKDVLRQLQSDELKGYRRYIPQVRLLTNQLTPEKGVKIFQESTLPKALVSHVDDVVYEDISRFLLEEDSAAA